MADCCIIGCDNKAAKRGEVKFYALPTAKSSRPFKVKRRRLWLEAIEKANGTSEGLGHDAQICSAHFVSGQMSLEMSNQDFIPSVFPKEHTTKSRRLTLRPRSRVLPESPKVTPKKRRPANEKVDLSNNIILPENNYCEPLEDEWVMEEEVVKKEVVKKEVVKEKVSKEEPPSSEETIEYVKLKNPKLEFKSIVDNSGRFRCEVCNGKFSTGRGLVKHKRLHEQEWSDEEETLPSVSDSMVKSEFFEKPNPVEEPSFQCNMCNRSFPTTHTLKRHKLLHVRDSRKCTLCGTMFCKRHNHIVAQPQISTENNFEDAETHNMNESAESQTLTSCDGDGLDEGLELLLKSDSLTLDAIAAAQEQLESPADPLHKEAPAITYNPRKPGLLTAFKSFLTKHKPSNIKPKQLKYIIGRSQSMMATQTTAACTNAITTTTPITTITVPITAITPPVTSVTPPITAPITTVTLPKTTATTPIIMASSTGMMAKPVPEPSSKTDGLTTSTKTVTPQPGKPVIIVSRQQQLSGPFQKMEQSTVCLSFSKPLPTTVIQEFMTYISKNESMKSSTAPRLVTFTTKQDQVIAKQETKEVASVIKLEPSTTPVTAPSLPEKSTVLPKQEKNSFMITTQPKSDLKTTTQIFKTPIQKPPIQKPSIQKPPLPKKTSAVPPVKPKNKLNKKKPKPTLQAPYQRPYVHGSRPPSPELIFAKIKRGPWDSPFPNYPKDFIQPHLPQTPVLPPALQMFSPQLLTSAMLEVERNFEYILN